MRHNAEGAAISVNCPWSFRLSLLFAHQHGPCRRAVAPLDAQGQADEPVRPGLDGTQVDALKDDDTGL